MVKKVCNKCLTNKELCEFSKSSRYKDGLDKICKVCQRERSRIYLLKNGKEVNERKKKWRADNKEHFAKSKKKWRDKNKEKLKKIRDTKKEQRKEYDRLYRIKNKEIIRERKKNYRENNREKINEYYRVRKSEDVLFKLNHTMRNRIRVFLKVKKWDKKKSTYNMIGCSPDFLKEYLEKQFKDGMSWENRGKWHIDHIIPLCTAKSEEELYKLCHYTNLQPLWGEENLKKGKTYGEYEIKK